MTAAESPARFEFRAWDQHAAEARLRLEGTVTGVSLIRDRYLLGPTPTVNAKLRDRRLEVKLLEEESAGFQRWRPEIEEGPPYATSVVRELMTRLGAESTPEIESDALSEPEVIDVVRDHPDLALVTVTKRRDHYEIDGVQAEITRVMIEPRGPQRTALVIESTDLDALVTVRHKLGLDDAENVPVNLALTRTTAGR